MDRRFGRHRYTVSYDGCCQCDGDDVPPAPIETVSLGAFLVMVLFVAIAALIVVSFICKLLVVIGWVPRKRTSRLRRTVIFLARAAGQTRLRPGDDDDCGRRPSPRGGGGSSGGAGASGDFS
jgi:uncharacterized membrane protein YgcG